jgi:hypothetical protein
MTKQWFSSDKETELQASMNMVLIDRFLDVESNSAEDGRGEEGSFIED